MPASDFGLVGIGADALLNSGGGSHRSDRSSRRYEQGRREDTAIQRRVADAKAAGVHPLYALGANVQASSPMMTMGSAPKDGTNAIAGLGRQIARQRAGGSSVTSAANAASLRLVDSQTNYYVALTQKALSDVARIGQDQTAGLRLARPGGHSYFGEILPQEGGIYPRRSYPSYWGTLEFPGGTPTGNQAEEDLGEGGGTVDSFMYYLQAIGRMLGMSASHRQDLARSRVEKRLRLTKPMYHKRSR